MIGIIFIDPAWGLAPFLAMAVLAGIGISAVQVLPWAMIPDAVEWDELSTGERHEGMFYSLVTLFRKIAVSVVVPLALLVLQATGYIANAAVQPETRYQRHPHADGTDPGGACWWSGSALPSSTRSTGRVSPKSGPSWRERKSTEHTSVQ